MNTHLYITFMERFFSDSLACVALPTIYPGCTYFWQVLYISALLFLTVICFYVMWNLYKQLGLQKEYEGLIKARSMIANSEGAYKWDVQNYLNSIAEAELADRIRKIHSRAN